MEVQLKLWKSNKCATLPTCNSLLPFCFGCLKVQEQRFPKYWFSFTCLMPWFQSSLLWFLDALCSFIIARMPHEGRSQHSVADMRVPPGALLNFGDNLSLEDLPVQRKHAKAFFSSNVPFFAEGRPDSVRKYGKMRPKYGNIRPVWTHPNQKDFFFKKRTFFFHVRPSIRQNCFSSWHHKIRASGCAQTQCMFRISVAMCKCLPPQLIIKSRRRFYIFRHELWIQSCSAMKF